MDILSSATLMLVLLDLCSSLPNGAPSSACESRTPNHFHFQPTDSNECEYALYSEKWEPGAAVRMAIFHDNETETFRGFLASIYHQHQPVGEMSLVATETEPKRKRLQTSCNGTSLTHTENSDKYFVSFDWIAPPFLPLDAELIVRLTVVANISEFYVDCRPYRLVPKSPNAADFPTSSSSTISTTEQTTKEETTTPLSTTPETTPTDRITTESTTKMTTPDTTTTTTSATTTTQMVTEASTTPVTTTKNTKTTKSKRRQGTGVDYTGQQNLKHMVLSDVSCEEGGNIYTLIKGTDCKEFVQHSAGQLDYGATYMCQGWARFSPNLCSCAYVAICPFP